LLAVDRPGYAELIDKHSKADAPEGFLEGHLHCAVFRKRVKYGNDQVIGIERARSFTRS
jgi:hypothetical protein